MPNGGEQMGLLLTVFLPLSLAVIMFTLGLGLTIAKDVATAHDGKITLENRSEGGACVTLSF